MTQQAKRVATTILFGTIIFAAKTFIPSPIDKMFIAVQALLLAFGALLLRKLGATQVAMVGGVLTALWRAAFAPLTFSFAIVYGLLVDGFFFLLKVHATNGKVKTGRLISAMIFSTMLAGLASYYVTIFVMGLIERNLLLEITILIAGTINGAVAGYFASIIWNKHLKSTRI